MSKFFRADIRPACKYCRFCVLGSSEPMLCKKRGPVEPEQSCRRFCYDPVKRVPSGSPALENNFTAEDFLL